MGLNETASADRIHIGFFGMRNAGKSSVVNAVTGQNLALVSDVKGTTTDPVKKAMELLPLGPVVIIDTPGFDDEGELGKMRVGKTRQVLNYADIAVLVVDATVGMQQTDIELKELFQKKKIPYIIVYNKSDLIDEEQITYIVRKEDADEKETATSVDHSIENATDTKRTRVTENEIYISAKTGENIHELKEKIASLVSNDQSDKCIVADLIEQGDTVILVIPIDSAAPKGRLILPQQQTIRDILDAGAKALVCRDTELKDTLDSLKNPPKLVITDSQAFGKVSKIVPKEIQLTSFSILFARYKGNLKGAVRAVSMLDKLKDGDKILISEGCTHHRQCGDIGTVKLPKWISEYTGKDITFEFTSGKDFPEELSEYALVVHCGGCMLTEREMQYRGRQSADSGVPMANYGMVIAHVNGILKRSLEPFPDIQL